MFRIYACLTQEHDPYLVILAGVVATVAAVTAFSLFAHAQASAGRGKVAWAVATALVTGVGIWATHFIAMLAFDPGVPVAFDVGLTALSVVIAVGVSGFGFALALQPKRDGSPLALIGGGVIGVAIFSMHYTGMAAVRVPAELVYDKVLVAASLVIGVGMCVLALHRFRRDGELLNRLECGTWMVLGICGLHFTGMGAATLEQAPALFLLEDAMPAKALALAVAAAVIVIAGSGIVASVVDQRVAERSHREAERLRCAVAELERTKAELEATGTNLREALEAASAGYQAKSQFLATMSHELRTPLNAVIGFSEVLSTNLYGPLTQRQRDCIDDIRRAGTHLLGLVNDVLDISRLDASAVQLEDEHVDLALAVDDAISLNALRAADGGLTLRREFPPTMPALRADARRLRQILVNLLSNAVKFTPAGGEICVRVAQTRDGLEISVADTGIGMAADEIPIALSRFGQVDSRLARKFEGTGLGLPLTKRLVELHGGAMTIESEVNIGTTVRVLFPNERLMGDLKAA